MVPIVAMRVLIIGARSKTAEAFLRWLRRQGPPWEVRIISHRTGEPQQIHGYPVYVVPGYARQPLRNTCLGWEPEIILNTAALTDVDACEEKRELAWKVNVELVGTLAAVCRILGAHLIQLSSDYVFNGAAGPYAEHERPDPINYYGRTKLAAENLCQTTVPSATIVRTTLIYGTPAPWCQDILRWALQKAHDCQQVVVARDVFTNPIFVDDLARVLFYAVQTRPEGIIHVAGWGWQSRYEFLQSVFRVVGLPETLLRPLPAAELYRHRAARPRYAGLRCARAEALWNFIPTPPTDALLRLLRRTHGSDSEESTE